MENSTEADYKKMLYNLLCVTHRDAGHYIEKYGIEKAYRDAKEIICSKIIE